MVPAKEEPAVLVLLPAELTGDGLRDMGDGVSVLLREVKGELVPPHTHHFIAVLNVLEKLTLHPSQGRMCSSTSWFYEKGELINWEGLKIKRDLILPTNEPVI